MSWIPSDILRHKRLDAPYYAVEHLETEAMIRRASQHVSFEALGSFARLWSGPFGSKLPSSLYRNVGPYPLYRSQNVKAFWIQKDGLVYLDTDAYNELKSCSAETGDILVSKAGFVGTACIVGRDEGPAIITEHVLGVRPLDVTDQHFLLATLNSTICRRQLEREGLGTILDYLGVEVSRELLVPRPKRPLQVAIGNKVLAAELLRSAAAKVWNTFSELVERLTQNFAMPNFQRWSSSFVFDELTSRRIDADYYRTDDLALRTKMISAGFVSLESQCDFIQSGRTPRSKGGQFRIVGVASLRTPVINPGTDRFRVPASTIHLKVGDVLLCNAAHDSTFIGRLNTLVGENDQLVPSSEVTVCRPKIPSHGVVIAHFLNTPSGYAQIQRAVRGMTAHLYPEDLGEVLVPQFEDVYSGFEADLVDLTSRWRRAESLTSAAIQNVEDLIEGKLDEASCLEEGRKLEDEFGLEMP